MLLLALPKKSAKRKKDDPVYKKVCDEIDEEYKFGGDYTLCFFCWKPIRGFIEHHHFRGRVGDYYTDKRYIVPGHWLCHTVIWHTYTMAKLKVQSWYQGFKSRLYRLDPVSYAKLIYREEKYAKKKTGSHDKGSRG